MKAIPALISVCTLTCLSSALGQVAVIDPSNLVQNALSAARSLQQVANQVKSLENEARNLIALGDGSSRDLIDRLSEMERLIASATDLARDLSAARAAMEHLAPPGGAGSTRADRQRLAAAQEAAIRDALAQTLAVQALVSGEIARDQAALARMADASLAAEGSLAAQQAGNELLAFQAAQMMRLEALLSASARTQALEGARTLEAEETARRRHERFFGGADRAHPSAPPWR
jgi:P-type conjugative transfer protein TrbJ